MRRWFKRKTSERSSSSRGSTADISDASATVVNGGPGQSLSKHFPVGIKAWHEPLASVVDVVFIHGLNGGREEAWSYGKKRPWPATLLPSHLPTARVLTFGYDAYVVEFTRLVSKNHIADHAVNLLSTLATYREKNATNDRPIVFVCHSLGGLVCQDALVHARQSPERHLRKLYECTRAIAFLGTPHRGSGLAKWAEMLAYELNLIKQTNSRIVGVLKRDSETLARVQDTFHMAMRSREQEKLPPIQITCFFEESPLPVVGLVVPRESAAIPGYPRQGIHRNHMDMTKFIDKNDPGFEALIGELRRWVNSLAESLPSKEPAGSPYSLTVSERGFLSSIGPRRYIDVDDRVDGTCVWSTQTSEYHSWAQSDQSSVLWITGGAGTGKTTLASYLSENLEGKNGILSDQNATHFACSFFCKRDIRGHNDAASLLQDLVFQLTASNRQLLRRIKKTYGTFRGDHSLSFENVWRMFEFALASVTSQCVYVTVDALDECDENLSLRLFSKFARFLTAVTEDRFQTLKRIKLVFSGQPQLRASWNASTERVKHYHISTEDALLADDLRLFVHVKVMELVRSDVCSQSDSERLEQTLVSKAENSFLWLDTVLKHMANSLRYHHTDIEDLLSEVPDNLQQAFANYLPSVLQRDVWILKRYLQLMTASSRPLKLVEIDTLANITSGRTPLPSAKEENKVKGSIQRALGPLVKFPNRTAQFNHSTVKEFFALLATQPHHKLYQSHGVSPTQAHLFCAQSCMVYLLHESVPQDPFGSQEILALSSSTASSVSDKECQDDDDGLARLFSVGEAHIFRSETSLEESLTEDICQDIQRRFPVYGYAATNWAQHLVHCQEIMTVNDANMALDLLMRASGPRSGWYRYLAHRTSVDMPSASESDPIVLAALFNLTSVMQTLLETPNDPLTSHTLFVALFWAAARGNFAAVQLLLDYNAPVSQSDDARLPLAVATQGDHVGICGMILSATDTDPNQLNQQGKSALVLAAEANHEQVLQILLSHPAILVNQVDGDGRTAVIAACRNRAVECLRLLRKDGRADAGHIDYGGLSAIHYASKAGDVPTLMELIEFPGLDLKSTDRNGRNAISMASREGHLRIVKLLRHKGVDAASADKDGRNAISRAANSQKATASLGDEGESVLHYLVRKFPHEADAPDIDGWSPLAWAVDTPGFLNSVRILLQSPWVDVNRRDLRSASILSWAMGSGMVDIIGCMLKRPELDVNAVSSSGNTALSHAAANGMIDVVRLLLEREDIAVNQPNKLNRTPADLAALNGHWEICDLLRGTLEQSHAAT